MSKNVRITKLLFIVLKKIGIDKQINIYKD